RAPAPARVWRYSASASFSAEAAEVRWWATRLRRMIAPGSEERAMTIKSALVTGAGGGLGRAVALALAERRCAVVALDINGPAAEETAREAASELITPLVM